ncbi:hypothetical protein SSX86_016042 [Deinandra increscens subsp. villosa]|uniref:Uncharacterized protein n=1 Tax=Deinandra increscens subsp. villosa TaxID=3103831 RepID=A0AAP0CX64_9ASTR
MVYGGCLSLTNGLVISFTTSESTIICTIICTMGSTTPTLTITHVSTIPSQPEPKEEGVVSETREQHVAPKKKMDRGRSKSKLLQYRVLERNQGGMGPKKLPWLRRTMGVSMDSIAVGWALGLADFLLPRPEDNVEQENTNQDPDNQISDRKRMKRIKERTQLLESSWTCQVDLEEAKEQEITKLQNAFMTWNCGPHDGYRGDAPDGEQPRRVFERRSGTGNG